MGERRLGPRRTGSVRSDPDPARRAGAAVCRTRVRGTESVQGRRSEPKLVPPARKLAAPDTLGAATFNAAGFGIAVLRGHRDDGGRLPPHHSARVGAILVPASVSVRHGGWIFAAQFNHLSLHG